MTDSTAATTNSAHGTSSARDSNALLEERMIDAEYKIWKKNTPYLYDFVMTHALEWPSLTCQWLPTIKYHNKTSGGSIVEHSMLLGTHTLVGEQNYLMVASINLPKADSDADRPVPIAGSETNGDDEREAVKLCDSSKKTPAAIYDEERSELGGYGAGDSSIGKIQIRMKIKHEGEVHRAKYMPQNHFIVATRGPQLPIFVWDLSRHSSFPEGGSSKTHAQGICIGHEGEGYGLCWSPHKAGWLVSSSEDRTVRLWNVEAAIGPSSTSGTQINPLRTFCGHTDVVEDVDWHHKDPNLIGSVGDDKSIRIWDVRVENEGEAVHKKLNAHDQDVNSIAFNPVNEFLFATGSADTTVALWDLRNLDKRVHTLRGHTDQVFNLNWAPFNESILASCSSDRRVAIWDLSRIGMEQSPEDAEDGPPELLFLHGGHTSKVSDFSWNVNNEWTVASVADDNVLQVWNMAEEIYALDDSDDQQEEECGKGALDEDDL